MRSVALVALAGLAPLVKSQTFSDCDPTQGDDCKPDPAFGQCQSEIEFDFAAVPHGDDGWKDNDRFNEFWEAGDGIDGQLSVDDGGLAFTIDNADQKGPLIKSNKFLFFGRVEVEVKAAPGVGIVTSVVLESKDRDEIDWEWLGGSPNNVQTNFFSRGVNELAAGNGVTHGIAFPATEGTHTYTIDWTPEGISFLVDGAEIRHAAVGDKAKWPQTPMQIKLGTWAGGHPDNEEGTIEWAGGRTDFGAAPFVGWYKSIKVVDYCGGKDGAKEYVWKDSSGTQASIEVVGADGDGGFAEDGKKKDDDKETGTTAAKPSKTGGEPSKTSSDSAEKTDDPDAAESSDQGDEGAASFNGVSPVLAAMVGLGYLLLA